MGMIVALGRVARRRYKENYDNILINNFDCIVLRRQIYLLILDDNNPKYTIKFLNKTPISKKVIR